MADWGDVSRIALALPEVVETDVRGRAAWKVRGKLFVWDRPLRASDRAALGSSAPEGPILGARVAAEEDKWALIAEDPATFFTIPHFDGYAAVLALLERMAPGRLDELVTDAWRLRAPRRVASAWEEDHRP